MQPVVTIGTDNTDFGKPAGTQHGQRHFDTGITQRPYFAVKIDQRCDRLTGYLSDDLARFKTGRSGRSVVGEPAR
jgi:hypothetical protein